MNKSKIVARLTVTREIGVVTMVEVHEDANFSQFYRYYSQEGRRRSTKKLIRTANRNEGLKPWHTAYQKTPGLEMVARIFESMAHVTNVKVRIIKKRAYKRLISLPADELGGVVTGKPIRDPRLEPRVTGIPVYIPQGHTTMDRKWSILTGRAR